MEWTELGVSEALSQGILSSFNFSSPTPVQRAVIPHFTGNKDVCVESCTGSGKTLSFLIPVVQKLLTSAPPSPFCLIISPSRELAQQTFTVCQSLCASFPHITSQCLIGGHDKSLDISDLQSLPLILIGTPGRLLDLVQGQDLKLKSIEVLILDEADRLLDLGFKDCINQIISALPKQRRTGLFSATMNTDVEHLVKAGLRNPIYVSVKVNKTGQDLPSGLSNFYCAFDNYKTKLAGLVRFLQKYGKKKIIVFFATCASTNFYLAILAEIEELRQVTFFRMHGKMKQAQREKVCQEFGESQEGVLLSTDLVARGIDFLDIKWIVQFDPPQNPDYFVHRIGRTARASKTGRSIIFLTQPETTYINYLGIKGIEFKTKKLKIDLGIFESVGKLVIKDRENYEKAQSAFVSYVRYYKEHLLNFIFQFKELDLGFLAQGFCLLRIPRVKEILGKKIENFEQSEIDPEQIAYLDTAKEERRQKVLLEKERERVRVLEEKKKKKVILMKKQNQRPRSRSEKRDAKRQMMQDDFDDLGKEEKIIKKIRQGKLNDAEVKLYMQENPDFKSFFRKKKH